MKIGIHNHYEKYNSNNLIFDESAYSIGNSLEYPAVLMRNKLAKLDINLSTLDMYPLEFFDKIIFFDMPDVSSIFFQTLLSQKKTRLYLVMFESEIILKENWDYENHKYFERVYTWKDSLVDNIKYFKYYWPNRFDQKLIWKEEKTKLCALMAGNKYNSDPRELYSERLKAINWFENNHPSDFDLFGFGWDKRHSNQRIFEKLLQFSVISRIFTKHHPCYKGPVDQKIEVLKNYKFSICFENAKGIEGYITEKIFDCFIAGSVPIYLGAPNISSFIPKDTFIDMREFSNYYELYECISNMPKDEYNNYLSCIRFFLQSPEGKLFSSENFAESIVNGVLED